MRKIVVAILGAAIIAPGLTSAVAYADPSDDDPGYVIDDGSQPGLEHLPRQCSTVPIACGLTRDPGSGAWLRPAPEPLH